MNTFLEYVAQDIISKYGTDLSRTALVFPNKRASLFINEYFAKYSDRPLWSPAYITISDLFQSHSDFILGDSIKLICDLYNVFIEITGSDETLDQFYGWGQLLCADFDDIDKNMANASYVFSNVSDLHELDDISYLDEEQINTLKKFFGICAGDNSLLKTKFITLWNNLYAIYDGYKKKLRDEGIAYEGMLYRSVVEDENINYSYDRYLFVGFNVLQKVEVKLFSHLKKEGKAKFYWDFDKYYMNDFNEAGHYIKKFINMFPNELDNDNDDIYNNFSKDKKIKFISASTENIQARYVSTWLSEKKNVEAGKKTAIVLCNEALLPVVIYSLPKDISEVNITTGYPLSQSPAQSLVNNLINLQSDGYRNNHYMLSYVNDILLHPYFSNVSTSFCDIHEKLLKKRISFPTEKHLVVDELTKTIFTHYSSVEDITKWLADIIKYIAINSSNKDQFFQESIFRIYTLINRLSDLVQIGDLKVNIITFKRLLNQLIGSTSIPFHGEPAVGLQIMGVLETRNLDFDNILILSVNEGNMPKGVSDTSFIPHFIRKAHDLTTVDNKVAVYAYYFYSMLQRAQNITLLYNTSTEGSHKNEMSRFMLQLLVESQHEIIQQSLKTKQKAENSSIESIEKSDEVIDVLLNKFDASRNKDTYSSLLSPTAINKYVHCQLSFFYKYVANIDEPDDNEDNDIDYRIFGNLFHKSAELLYTKLQDHEKTITKSAITTFIKHPEMVYGIIDDAFKDILFNRPNDRSFRPEYNGEQLIYREAIRIYILNLLKKDMSVTPFSIIELEQPVSVPMQISINDLSFKTMCGGKVDRIDKVSDGSGGSVIRIIDYKTGQKPTSLNINEISEIVNPKNKLAGYYLQTLLYSLIVRSDTTLNPAYLNVVPSLLYVRDSSDEDNSILMIDKEEIYDIKSYEEDYWECLKPVICEMFDKNEPFVATENSDNCNNCPYARLCGKSVKNKTGY